METRNSGISRTTTNFFPTLKTQKIFDILNLSWEYYTYFTAFFLKKKSISNQKESKISVAFHSNCECVDTSTVTQS